MAGGAPADKGGYSGEHEGYQEIHDEARYGGHREARLSGVKRIEAERSSVLKYQ